MRRRNFIKPEQFPYRTHVDDWYDAGEFARILDRALGLAERWSEARVIWEDLFEEDPELDYFGELLSVITSYSIHYTKLYEAVMMRSVVVF